MAEKIKGKRAVDSEEFIEIPVSKAFNAIKKNIWLASSVILFILIIVFVLILATGSVSESTASSNLISFINSQGNGEATVVSSVDDGDMYKITVSYNGQQIPVYVTKDGKYLVSDKIPLKTEAVSNSQVKQNIPKSDKPTVELFVMSHCPYGTQVEKGIIPVVDLLNDKINFEIKWVYYAMHGQTEVNEELRQHCIQSEQNIKYLDYLRCFLTAGDSSGCLKNVSIDENSVNKCMSLTDDKFNVTAMFNDKSSWLSGKYPKMDIYLQDNKKYSVAGSPTLVINGVQAQSGRDSDSLLKTICSAFNSVPSECSKQLSSASPSAGFGWGQTSTSSAANCIS